MSWSSLPEDVRERAERDLSPRQLEVVKLVVAGRSVRQIALALSIAPSTVTSTYWRAKQILSELPEEAA